MHIVLCNTATDDNEVNKNANVDNHDVEINTQSHNDNLTLNNTV